MVTLAVNGLKSKILLILLILIVFNKFGFIYDIIFTNKIKKKNSLNIFLFISLDIN